MNIYDIIKLIIVIIALAFSCYTDIKERKIKNKVTFPLMLFGLIINFIENPEFNSILFSFKGMIFIFLVCIIVSIVNGFGFGDTKLLMGLASIYGLWYAFDILLYALLTMVLYFFIFKFSLIKKLIKNMKFIIQTFLLTKHLPKFNKEESVWTVPYAIFITLGYIITLLYNNFIGGTLIWNILN